MFRDEFDTTTVAICILEFMVPFGIDLDTAQVQEVYRVELPLGHARFALSVRGPIAVILYEKAGAESMAVIKIKIKCGSQSYRLPLDLP